MPKKGLWTLNEVVIAGAPGRTKEDYALGHEAGIDVRFGQTHDLLNRAQFAWVASGTATLESALLGTPHALVYRTSALTYFLAKQFVKVKFIGLPNLLLGREVVPELIQDALKLRRFSSSLTLTAPPSNAPSRNPSCPRRPWRIGSRGKASLDLLRTSTLRLDQVKAQPHWHL